MAAKDAVVISWEGDSLEVLRSFPSDVRQDIGAALRKLQQGEIPPNIRPMKSIGSGVFEVKEQDQRAWYRVVYLSKVRDTIYVLHCFEKESAKTERVDLQTAKLRLIRVRKRITEGKKMKKEKVKKVSKSSPIAATHVTRGNVFEDLGFSQEESRTFQLKTDAHTALIHLIKDNKYTQKELSILLDQPQPRISELLNGKISKLSLEKLVDYLERLGAHTSLKVQTRNVKRITIQRYLDSL